MAHRSKRGDPLIRGIVTLVALIASIGAALSFVAFVYVAWVQGYLAVVIERHYAAIIGLQGCAGLSLIIVALFRQREGPIELEGPGFKAKGATGPVLLWVICFLSIAWTTKEMWGLGVN